MLVRHDNKQKRLTQCDFAEFSIEDRVPLRLSPHSKAFIETMQQIAYGSLTHTGIFVGQHSVCWKSPSVAFQNDIVPLRLQCSCTVVARRTTDGEELKKTELAIYRDRESFTY